eukprot:CAMPEP_0170626932 /NCGR_PEP_ID=MMETSP0224-20130122/31646_1 /TAXON_ID=285029 /ORGANISM="Togula jolla, Strain CCCM 725" /LENGTH=262 /DNA_ID=CAMNT_0010953787 /DNA_START=17 /DNA_END=806 /DNA_ORIENTATION=+
MAIGQQTAELKLKYPPQKAENDVDLGPLAPEVPSTVLSLYQKINPGLALMQQGDPKGQRGPGRQVRGVAKRAAGNDWPFDTAQETTTLMLRQIPLRCTQQRLMHIIDKVGFKDRYNFLYMPTHGRSCINRGFAFCNLESEKVAKEFFRMCHGRYLPAMLSKEPLDVCAAEIQGYERNIIHHAIKFSDQQRCPTFFFRPPPTWLVMVQSSALEEQTRPVFEQAALAELSAKVAIKWASLVAVAAKVAVKRPHVTSKPLQVCRR